MFLTFLMCFCICNYFWTERRHTHYEITQIWRITFLTDIKTPREKHSVYWGRLLHSLKNLFHLAKYICLRIYNLRQYSFSYSFFNHRSIYISLNRSKDSARDLVGQDSKSTTDGLRNRGSFVAFPGEGKIAKIIKVGGREKSKKERETIDNF